MSVAVRRLTGSDAAAVARMRVAVADRGLLTGLGTATLARFIRLAAEDPDTFGHVAVEDDSVVGFALCTSASVRLQRDTLRSSPAMWVRVPLLAVRDPATLWLGFRRLLSLFGRRRGTTRGEEPKLRLFDIAVTPSARGQGVGRALLDAALAEARVRRLGEIGLTVLRDNAAAIRLYRAVGFAPNRTATRDDGRAILTMRLILDEARSSAD
jgi:ribosomal protein S18 acetylase RimI-like enzyme